MTARYCTTDLITYIFPNPKVQIIAEEPKEKNEQDFQWADLRKEKRTKSRGKSKGLRNWNKIDTIVLHQTAVDFGLNPKRMLNVPVHGATLKDGKIILLHPPEHYLYHANKANKFSIGIEVSCRAAGIEGNPKTFWMGKHDKKRGKTYEDLIQEATDIQLEATKELCRYYIRLAEENGGKIKYIMPHRCSSASRVSDPGSKIWKNVAIPIMDEFGLELHEIVGNGLALPQAWDPIRGKDNRYNWRVKGF